ncbi:hypothetical protein SAMN05421819_2229 [Bryocella elongata]|uniref:Uncharacterized protein n=1 Tax=Bryocella elongata TaxID=863522 RepID=A0A1H5YCJ6_9BACT|nr:hypothetical protein [Bryocella elongata]SEG21455.1 hypothetical protein SAMN05421819_2229 [Bryocella elongata]
MRRLTLATTFAAGLLLALPMWGRSKPKPNPADYPVKVHVVVSRLRFYNGFEHEVIEAYVDGRYEELSSSNAALALLAPGDYVAQLVDADKHPKAYEAITSYSVLFPDGSTRSFDVTGVGIPPAANPQ